MMRSLLVGLGALAFLAVGCGGNGGEDGDNDVHLGCTVASPAAGSIVSGEVQVGIAFEGFARHLQLLVDGAVVAETDVAEDAAGTATLTWNTADTADGSVELTAKAIAGDVEVSSEEPVAVTVDNTAPVVSLAFERLAVLQGTVDLPVTIEEPNVASARLLSRTLGLADDGEVVTQTMAETPTEIASWTSVGGAIAWDTTTAESRVHYLTLEVTDAAGHTTATTGDLPVVVANGGEAVPVDYVDPLNLANARVYVPDPPEGEIHTRSSATMDETPIVRVISWVRWDPADAWLLEYSVGQGFCPHRGVKYVGVEGEGGELLLEVAWADLPRRVQVQALINAPEHPDAATTFPYNADPLTCGAFFGHVAPMDAVEHVGQELPIEVDYIFIYEQP